MFTNRNRHGLLPEIDFKLTIIISLSGIENLSNNAHFIFFPLLTKSGKTQAELFCYPSALYRSCDVTFLQGCHLHIVIDNNRCSLPAGE
ncbi:TPA_asm: hypothetical protein G0B27_05400 [Salmonella enterica subsp. indica]|uniref:Uncharacterized protein n=1 Tax=Salmonella enterica TaxID=28901 RepID=A0A702EEC5_SALER|nr:hypothetical protein [Salmonella enterica subsp. indica]